MTTAEMRQARRKHWEDAQAIHKLARDEKRELTAEENQSIDKLLGESDALEPQIKAAEEREAQEREAERRAAEEREARARRLAAIGADIDRPLPRRTDDGAQGDAAPETREERSHVDAFRAYLRLGMDRMRPEHRERLAGEYRDLAVGTGSAGGFTVPQAFYRELIAAMKRTGIMLDPAVVDVLNTADGQDIPMPTANDTAQVGELLAENAAAANQDVTFAQVILKAYMWSSKTVYVSFQLLQDNAVNLEQRLAQLLGERIARALNSFFTTGTGTAQPKGVVTAAALGKTGASGQTTSIKYVDVLDLIESVDAAYHAGASFMTSQAGRAMLRSVADNQARPLWIPGSLPGEADRFAGYPLLINNNIAVPAASAKSVLFGDFKTYKVRLVNQVQLLRIAKNEDKLQTGFLAWLRADGNQVDGGGGAIKHYANAAS